MTDDFGKQLERGLEKDWDTNYRRKRSISYAKSRLLEKLVLFLGAMVAVGAIVGGAWVTQYFQ